MNRQESILIAQEILNTDFLAIDIETTSLNTETGGLAQIALVNRQEKVVFSSLVNPSDCEIDNTSMAINKIQLAECIPTEYAILRIVAPLLESYPLLVYNSRFDISFLKNRFELYNMKVKFREIYDLMPIYAAFVGEWNDKFGDWKWQKLPNLSFLNSHDAISDCISTIRLLSRISKNGQTEEILSLDDL